MIFAHGVGGRIDLPLPAWQLAWAAGFAVAISFVALGTFWSQPRLAAASAGSPLPKPLQKLGTPGAVVARVVGLAGFALTLVAAWWGLDQGSANLAPVAVFITFWVGLQLVSFLIGDLWRAANPIWALADAGAWLRAKVTATPMSAETHGQGTHWPAVASIFAFLWMELAYHSADSPRSIGLYLTAYTATMLVGAAVFGRGWVRTAEGFGVLFSKLAAMAPFYRDDEGVLRKRLPLSGLATIDIRSGTVPFILTVLGSTSFDGFTRSSWWLDLTSNKTGWDLTAISTVGLVAVILVVASVYAMAIVTMQTITGDSFTVLSNRFGPSLVPIAAAYAVAHYFSLFVLEGQEVIFRISDPLSNGSNLFGTIDFDVDYRLVSTFTIAWVQTVAIAVGHVFGVATAHDRAIEVWDHRTAVRSQYPMLVVMIVYTIFGLFLLLGR